MLSTSLYRYALKNTKFKNDSIAGYVDCDSFVKTLRIIPIFHR